jgi:hypothetical protein
LEEPAIDWESPAGPVDEQLEPRLSAPDFLFLGPGDSHWIGQPCAVLVSVPGNPSAQLVRLACGCRALVPRAALHPV